MDDKQAKQPPQYPPAPSGVNPETWATVVPVLWPRLVQFWQAVERDRAKREAEQAQGQGQATDKDAA